jgi:hypothetical protein
MLGPSLQMFLHFVGLLCTNLVASHAILDDGNRQLVAAVSSTIQLFLAHYSLKTPTPASPESKNRRGPNVSR